MNGTNVDVAQLEVTDLVRLTAHEFSEVEKLLHAATSPGSFWVDLRHGFAKSVPANREKFHEAVDHYFTHSHEAKWRPIKKGRNGGESCSIYS